MLATLFFFKGGGGGGLAQIKPLTGYGSCLIHKNRNRTTLFFFNKKNLNYMVKV